MSEKKSVRLNKLVKEFNVSIDRIFTFLETKGVENLKPSSKVSHDIYMDLLGEFDSQKKAKLSAELLAKEKELAKAEEIIKQQEFAEKAKNEAEEKTLVEQEKATKLVNKVKKEESPEAIITNLEIYSQNDLLLRKTNTKNMNGNKGEKLFQE